MVKGKAVVLQGLYLLPAASSRNIPIDNQYRRGWTAVQKFEAGWWRQFHLSAGLNASKLQQVGFNMSDSACFVRHLDQHKSIEARKTRMRRK